MPPLVLVVAQPTIARELQQGSDDVKVGHGTPSRCHVIPRPPRTLAAAYTAVPVLRSSASAEIGRPATTCDCCRCPALLPVRSRCASGWSQRGTGSRSGLVGGEALPSRQGQPAGGCGSSIVNTTAGPPSHGCLAFCLQGCVACCLQRPPASPSALAGLLSLTLTSRS